MSKSNSYKELFFGIATVLLTLLIILIAGESLIRGYQFVRGIKPSIVIDRELGWAPGPNLDILTIAQDAASEYYLLRITSDENGFRMFGNPEVTDRRKIMVIGDSFTQAMEVSDDKTYFSLLRESLDAEIFAMGTGGYGTLQSYLMLRNWIDIVQPDAVILQFCTNDFVNNHYGLEKASIYNNNGLKRPYLIDGEIVRKLPRKMPTVRHFANRHSRFLYYIFSRIDIIRSQMHMQSVEHSIYATPGDVLEFKEAVEVTGELFQKLAELTTSNGAELFVFSEGNLEPYYQNFLRISEGTDGLILMDGIAEALLQAEESGRVIRAGDFAHWNNEGHRVVASVITEFLDHHWNLRVNSEEIRISDQGF